jgi:hypothetical protein
MLIVVFLSHLKQQFSDFSRIIVVTNSNRDIIKSDASAASDTVSTDSSFAGIIKV